MVDGKRNQVPADSSLVNVYERHDVKFWTGKWGCTQAELRAAVEATNSIRADKLETYLKRNKDEPEG
jgi:hypothetical protein